MSRTTDLKHAGNSKLDHQCVPENWGEGVNYALVKERWSVLGWIYTESICK